MKRFDALVVGGGPAGMTAALYLLRSGISLAWVEMLAPGGQVLKTEWIDNYPGFPKGVRGYELADLFAAHLERFSFEKYTERVERIEPQNGGPHRVLVGETWIEARSIIVCSGASHKSLNVPGEDRLAGRGVSYCAICDGQFFRDQVVACVGGGDSALEESLYLAKLVRKVYLIHRRDAFRGTKIYQEKVLAEPKIELVLNSVVTEITGSTGVEGVTVSNITTGQVSKLDVSGVFVFVGISPHVSFLPEELARDRAGFILTDAEMRTNIPGIFAAGDVRVKLCRQVSTAVGDGATAAFAAGVYLEGRMS